jgi:hypothetical protein
MRMATFAAASVLTGMATLAGCGKPAGGPSTTTFPARKAGLWEQSMTRDGKPGRLGALNVCLDAAADARLGLFGRHFGKPGCPREVSRDGAGVYHFHSTCTLDNGAVVNSRGDASGDFNTDYQVYSEISVSGAPYEPMNGVHTVTITGRYKGACPADMRPGEVSLGSGLRVSMDRLAEIAAALEPGASRRKAP